MKKIFNTIQFIVAILVCMSSSLWAQTGYEPARNQLNSIFAPLNKTQITTGILHEYGYQLIKNPEIDATDTLDYGAWNGIYYSLLSGRISGTQTLQPLDNINTIVDGYANVKTEIQIPVLHYNFNTMRTDAVSANLLRVSSNKLYDVAGRTQSPYLSHTVFAAALERGFSPTGNVNFIFRSNLFFQNRSKTLQKIEFDAADGLGYRIANFNVAFSASYPTAGIKICKTKFTYTDGTSAVAQTMLEVAKAAQPAAVYAPTDVANVPIAAVNALHSGGRMQIIYSQRNPTRSTADPRLMKPLIIAEGFDMSSTLDLADNYTIETFISNRGIQRFGNFFSVILDDIAGYDLVFIDYADGTDDIKRNAALFQEVIRRVNASKAPNVNHPELIIEQNVVMGMSMGGLIARYGLADMEKKRRTNDVPDNRHETRLYISHDSPHRGANIPVGIERMVRYFADDVLLWSVVKPIRQAIQTLNRPAPQQQILYLLQRNSSGNYSFKYNTFLDGEYRDMITYPTGNPAPYREIAVSNGAECGQPLFAPGRNLINITAIPTTIFSRLAGFSLNWSVSANALPNLGQSSQIFNGRVFFRVRIFTINIDIVLNNQTMNSATNMLPLDGAAGGTNEIADFDFNGGTWLGVLWRFVVFGNSGYIEPRFSFIPTASALDVQNFNTNTLNVPYNSGISPTNPSLFSNFITEQPTAIRNGEVPRNNLPHVIFTPDVANWLYAQMENLTGSPDNCNNVSLNCNPVINITAENGVNICTTNTYEFSAPFFEGATYTWSVGNGLQIISGQNTREVVITANNGINASSPINLTITTICGNIIANPLNLQVNAGVIGGTYSYSGYTYPVSSGNNGISVSNSSISINLNHFADPNTTYTWQITGQSSSGASASFNGKTASISLSAGKYLNCTCTVTTPCGSTSASFSCYNYASGGFLMASPNPADQSIEVSLVEEQAVTESSEPATTLSRTTATTLSRTTANVSEVNANTNKNYSVKIFSPYQVLMYEGNHTGNTFQIPTQNLPNGLYILQVISSEGVLTKQILIQH